MITLVVFDREGLMRAALVGTFAESRDIRVAEQTEDLETVLLATRHFQPAVVLLGVNRPDEAVLEVIRRCTTDEPAARVIVLASTSDRQSVGCAIAAGASGFLLKDAEPEELQAAVRSVAQGGVVLAPAATRVVVELVRDSGPPTEEEATLDLSSQEREVLRLLAQGLTNREIGAALGLSPHTVKAYVRSMLTKLRVPRRAALAAFASGRHPSGRSAAS